MRIQNFDFHVDLMRSILWQYETAPRAIQLARNDQAYIDSHHEEFWRGWFRDVFDLTTANQFGLSVWARILDLPLKVTIESSTEKVWGFSEDNENFNNGSFGDDGRAGVSLDVETARKLLRLRWVKLTMRPTVPNLNRALLDIFGPGVEVIDSYDMKYATYLFKVDPGYRLRQALEHFDALPRPSGVGVAWIIGEAEPVFGFAPTDLNFNNGSFGA